MKPVGAVLSQLDRSLPIGPRAGVIYYRLLMYTLNTLQFYREQLGPTPPLSGPGFLWLFLSAVMVNSIMKRNTHIQSLPFAYPKDHPNITIKKIFITENFTSKTRDNRESHTQYKRSQRISHTRQAVTENCTHKRRENRELHTQGKR